MTTRMFTRVRSLPLLLVCLFAAHGVALSQTLYDVVVSLSDRQRVLKQGELVGIHLKNESSGQPAVVFPSEEPIDWVGVGTQPTKVAVDALGIGRKIALLNQAVAEFDYLKHAFLNSSDAEFAAGSVVGTLKPYDDADFDALPRATPENYQALLGALAQRIRTLRLVQWPAAYRSRSYEDETFIREVVAYHDPHDSNNDGNREPYIKLLPEGAPAAWQPASISPGNLDVRVAEPSVGVGYFCHAGIGAYGSYSESASGEEGIPAPLREQKITLHANYPEEVRISATAPGADAPQIDGTVYILRRSYWHQLDAAGVPARFDPEQAGFVVETEAYSGTIPLFSAAPPATIKGRWEDVSPTLKRFHNNSFTHAPGSNDHVNSYESNWRIACVFGAVFKPAFTRGVDAAGLRDKLQTAEGIRAAAETDGHLSFQPRPQLLFGIELGPGLKGSGKGYITGGALVDNKDYLTSGWPGQYFWNYYSNYGWYLGTWMPRFDSTYSLRFAGSCADYHVVHDNDRTARNQSLPDAGWPYADVYGDGLDITSLYYAWDSPRLRQVAGRDLVADIEYGGAHYGGYTVKIYRRPVDTPTPTPGVPLPTGNMALVRTWDFSQPDAGMSAHPDVREKLEVNGNGGERYEIQANHMFPHLMPYDWWYADDRAWWKDQNFWPFDEWSWTFRLSEGSVEKARKEIRIASSMATTINDHLDGQAISNLTSPSYDPFGDHQPRNWTITSAGETITGTAVLGEWNDPAYGYGKWPTSVAIDYGGVQPNASYTWDRNGLLSSAVQGPWSVTGTLDGDAHKLVSKFGGTTVGTTVGTAWTEFLGGGNRVKTYSAPDATASLKTHPSVAWSEVEYGTATVGLPGLPHIARSSDGMGATYAWATSADGSHTLTMQQGTLTDSSVSKGVKVVREANKRGNPVKTDTFLINGGTVKTSQTDYSDMTPWGTPKKATDALTGLVTEWTLDGGLSRLTGHTGPLGLTSTITQYDVLGRPGSFSANGITTARTYEGFSTTDAITGSATGSAEETRDALGRLTANNVTWNGVTNNLGVSYGTSATTITGGHSLLGSSETTIRKDDGSLDTAVGDTLAFGGVTGDALSVSNGLLVIKTAVAGQPGAFAETHADAWGRTHKVVTPSKSGGSTETNIAYSAPSSSTRRVIITEPTGRILITESEDNGTITRSGIDVNGNGSLGATDRYTESTTTVTDGKIVTTLKVTDEPGDGVIDGLREIMESEWTPSSGVTVTKINGEEETITTTPDHAAKTVTTTSSKGWERTTGINNLGLAIGNSLTGTGLPATDLTPTWRADGSLAGVSLEIGGETHTATFNTDSTLATLTAPGRGNILGGHSISNGIETLTVDGVTMESKLDGTETDTSGSEVIGKEEKLTIEGGGYNKRVTPEAGAHTDTTISAAGAPLAKTYADASSESYGYEDELLTSITLARGIDKKIDLGYSDDGAKDLTSADWPAMDSGVFTGAEAIPGITFGYDYNRAGKIKELGDPSGVRSLDYQNGRLSSTAYTSGLLQGYEIIRGRDTSGRHTGTLIKRGGNAIHTTQKAPNGASDQITDLASGNITATPRRDGANRITGYVWSDGTNTVTQTWQRGAGGRIEFAGSDVSGAPTFDYLLDPQNPGESFDARNRRLKCQTAGGTWTCVYGAGGQISSAKHKNALGALFGDGGEDSINAVRRAIENVTVRADLDGKSEWKHINAHAGLSGEEHFGGQYKPALAALNTHYAPVIAQARRQHQGNRLFERAHFEAEREFQSSFGYKIREIGLATADLPMQAGGALASGLLMTDITTGTTFSWNGWGNGYGLAEISPGERAFAAGMIFIPVGRGGSFVDDFVRAGARGGAYRRVSNFGDFADLPVTMNLKTVRSHAIAGGVGLDGVRVRIVKDADLKGRGVFGYADPNGRQIDLYPDAFSSPENLIRTLGHERTHVYQFRTLGPETEAAYGGSLCGRNRGFRFRNRGFH